MLLYAVVLKGKLNENGQIDRLNMIFSLEKTEKFFFIKNLRMIIKKGAKTYEAGPIFNPTKGYDFSPSEFGYFTKIKNSKNKLEIGDLLEIHYKLEEPIKKGEEFFINFLYNGESVWQNTIKPKPHIFESPPNTEILIDHH